jgi:hypothetical protein
LGPSIISGILRGKRFAIKNGLYYVPCNAELYDSFFIKVTKGGYWLEFPPETFILPVKFSSHNI